MLMSEKNESDHNEGPGLVASPVFWIGAALSVMFWIGLIVVVARL